MSEYYGQYEDYTKDDAWWNQQGHHQGDLWNDTAGGPGNQSAYRSAGSYGTSHIYYIATVSVCLIEIKHILAIYYTFKGGASLTHVADEADPGEDPRRRRRGRRRRRERRPDGARLPPSGGES